MIKHAAGGYSIHLCGVPAFQSAGVCSARPACVSESQKQKPIHKWISVFPKTPTARSHVTATSERLDRSMAAETFSRNGMFGFVRQRRQNANVRRIQIEKLENPIQMTRGKPEGVMKRLLSTVHGWARKCRPSTPVFANKSNEMSPTNGNISK